MAFILPQAGRAIDPYAILEVFPARALRGPVAQSVEHLPFKQRVAGSSPARLTTSFQ